MPPRAIVEAKVGMRWSLIPSLVRPCIINTATRAGGPPAAVYTSVGPKPSTSGPREAHSTALDSCVLPLPPCRIAPTREKTARRVASRDLDLLISVRFGQRSSLEYPTGQPRRTSSGPYLLSCPVATARWIARPWRMSWISWSERTPKRLTHHCAPN